MTLASLIDGQLAYGLTPLLDRASFTLIAGERIGLIGRIGTGKSSLMGVLTGRVPLEAGEMHIRSGLRIALVEQEPILPPAEGLLESLRLRGGLEDFTDDRMRWRVEARLIEYMERFKLATDVAPERASGGEKKRAEILQMAALKPEIAILDETDSGLDIDALRIVSEGVNALSGPEMGVLVITHYQRLLNYIKPQFVHIMMGGRIVESGGPELALHLEESGYDWVREKYEEPAA